MKNILILFVLFPLIAASQSDTIESALKISGNIEVYYCYDFGNPSNHVRPSFVYSYNRHNEVNLNLGFLKAAYEVKNARANFGIMSGTYANANLASEPGVLKNIFEANAGVKLSQTKNLWVDAGVFASHIGFESAVGKDCWNLTRSILADNSPYYESGAKIAYTSDNSKWYVSALFLNGWQRIQKQDGNNSPSFGHQLTFKPNAKITLNSSSFIGNTKPDSAKQMRYFHNFYGQFQIHDKFGLIVGFDIGLEEKGKLGPGYNEWYSPVVIIRYALNKKMFISTRAEYYSDEHKVIISSAPDGFRTFGYSLNIDYFIAKNALWRIEGRNFTSQSQIFTEKSRPSFRNNFITTSLSLSF